MSGFDTVIVVDWASGRASGPAPRSDAIWIGAATQRRVEEPVYCRTRGEAEAWLVRRITAERAQGRRVLAAFDFPFTYPAGFAQAVTGSPDPFSLWAWFAARVTEDARGENNRFDLAGQINRMLSDGAADRFGPFWGNPLKREIEGLPRRKTGYDLSGFPEKRGCEAELPGTFTCWQLAGAGAVGAQVIMGLPMLHRLRAQFAGDLSVWPMEAATGAIVLAETWPSLLKEPVREAVAGGEIKDSAQVRLLSQALAHLPGGVLAGAMAREAAGARAAEGAILGAGLAREMLAVLETVTPPPLSNDCFALPAGVRWTPVDAALEQLQARLRVVALQERLPVGQAAGRILARDVFAMRSNPPEPNTAVDGYGFAHASLRGDGPYCLPLVEGRSAAGAPFAGAVPKGSALRVLTGASLPVGVDTVVLEEDVRSDGAQIVFRGPVKMGSNARAAGEDVQAGAIALPAGRRVTPADCALMSAVGVREVESYVPLRVGILSTGEELVEAGDVADTGQIYDANRPMLKAQIAAWGMEPVDLGRAADTRGAVQEALDLGAGQCDAILTSGGASAGDEDHVSALLAETGSLANWRIALKPGRPLALGVWLGVPVFGLPGNPVAALVCTLIFARPALSLLAGAGWQEPQGFDVPAGFSKRKKAGRREYLRARIRDGRAEVFKSEGSGRISGLSWAEGLVELPDAAIEIAPGDRVRYLPFGLF
jgi:molybdopterin molybdotransferase